VPPCLFPSCFGFLFLLQICNPRGLPLFFHLAPMLDPLLGPQILLLAIASPRGREFLFSLSFFIDPLRVLKLPSSSARHLECPWRVLPNCGFPGPPPPSLSLLIFPLKHLPSLLPSRPPFPLFNGRSCMDNSFLPVIASFLPLFRVPGPLCEL